LGSPDGFAGIGAGFWIVLGSGIGLPLAIIFMRAYILDKPSADSEDEGSEADDEELVVARAERRAARRAARREEVAASRTSLTKSIPVIAFSKSKLSSKAKQSHPDHRDKEEEEVRPSLN
jgi:hypothetical protein